MSESYMNQGTSVLAEGVRIIKGSNEPTGVIKVAAYCRVSTNLEIQQRSLDIQIEAFNRVIREHPGWELAGIYADKGISGTQVRHREEFKRMIEDAKAGKIQYILAKSISRFARNTVDVLMYVRELKEYGVPVFFEKEKLDTGNITSEFLLSIFAANAQEEIVSLSNNMKVGRRMRAAAGIAQWTCLYGYRRAENGDWVIEEKEAEIVRRIFREYVSGKSLPEISDGLRKDGIPSMQGKEKWYPTAMAHMLHNERYIGDILIQKSYISDPISHTRVDNRDAKLKQYYKENNHPAIVSREEYQIVQTIMAMKDQMRGCTQYPYYGTLKCPICGANMVRFIMSRNNHTFAWTCGGQKSPNGNLRKDRSTCPPYYFVETYVDEGFWKAMMNLDPERLREIASGRTSERSKAAAEILQLMPDGTQPFPKIEYYMLYRLVRKISFPRWDVMKVNWKCGLISETEIEYMKVGDLPYPTIEKKDVEHITRHRRYTAETYVINGKPLFWPVPTRQVAAIWLTQETVQNLLILDPKPYENGVPHVYGRNTVVDKKKLGGIENAHSTDCAKDSQEESGSVRSGQHII